MNVESFQFLLIYFVFSVVTAHAQNDEDAVCRKMNTKSLVYTCKKPADCDFNLSRKVACNSGKSPTKICCPRRKEAADVVREKCLQYINETTYETIYEESPILFVDGQYVRRSICDPVETQIVGGGPADRDEYPHMALIGYPTSPDVILWNCGGSLISERFILSAAHCGSIGNTNARWALLGELDRPSATSKDVRPGQFEIETAFPHPDYKEPGKNDIILFKLRKTVTFGKSMRPICLHTYSSIPKNQLQKLIITGWGMTGPDDDVSNNLKEAATSLALDSSCRAHYENYLRSGGYNPQSMMCAGGKDSGRYGNDTCSGDSGGPIQFQLTKYQCMYFQVGIVSVGSAFCGRDPAPAIYTKVANYINWIQPIVWP